MCSAFGRKKAAEPSGLEFREETPKKGEAAIACCDAKTNKFARGRKPLMRRPPSGAEAFPGGMWPVCHRIENAFPDLSLS